MRTSAMIEFSLEEYEKRLGELTVRMKACGLDGIVLSNRENTRYYCDLQSIIWSSKVSTPGMLIVNGDGKALLVGSASAVETARYTCCLDPEDVVCYNRNGLPGIPSTYPEAVTDAIRRLGLSSGRLGMELGEGSYLQLQLHWFEDIASQLPGVEFVDASPLITAQRAIKSPAEIALLRKVCETNEQSLRYAFEHVELDKSTETDFFRLFAQEAFRRHCENVTNDLIPLSVLYGAERFPLVGCPAGETVIANTPHAPLQASGGLYAFGYYSDLTRTGVVGSLNDRQQRMLDAARGARRLALSMIHDGASVKAVTDAVDQYALASPAAAEYLSRGNLGHGIGLDLREPPYLQKLARQDETFRAGMTLAIGPAFGCAETGRFALTQNIAVTPTGVELLSSGDGEPYLL